MPWRREFPHNAPRSQWRVLRIMITRLKGFFAAFLIGALPMLGSATAQAQAFVNLGHVNLSFYEGTANVIKLMLERAGGNVAMTPGSHSQIFPKVAEGEVDLFVAAWLPHAHASYWEEHKKDLVKLGTLYDGAKLYWAVPDYVSADEVKSVADLKKPEVVAKMVKSIRGTLPDSGLMIGSKKIFDAYGLTEAGYELVPGPAKEWIANFNDRIEKKEWFVMPLWQPQYLNKAHKMRVLDEPQKILGGENTAYLIANKNFVAKLTKPQRKMLGRIELSVKAVTEIDYMINVDKMTPHDAARRWISRNPTTVEYWIAGADDDQQ